MRLGSQDQPSIGAPLPVRFVARIGRDLRLPVAAAIEIAAVGVVLWFFGGSERFGRRGWIAVVALLVVAALQIWTVLRIFHHRTQIRLHTGGIAFRRRGTDRFLRWSHVTRVESGPGTRGTVRLRGPSEAVVFQLSDYDDPSIILRTIEREVPAHARREWDEAGLSAGENAVESSGQRSALSRQIDRASSGSDGA